MNCKTCLWWKSGYCERLDRDETFVLEVYVADDHDLETKIRTAPDFGCVLHTPKEIVPNKA